MVFGGRAWWHLSLVSALGRGRQISFEFEANVPIQQAPGQPGLQRPRLKTNDFLCLQHTDLAYKRPWSFWCLQSPGWKFKVNSWNIIPSNTMLLNKVPVDSGNSNIKTFSGFTWKEIIHKIFLPWVTEFKYIRFRQLFREYFLKSCVCTMCMTGASRSEGDTGSPGSGVTDVCESPCWCWDLNLDPLQE